MVVCGAVSGIQVEVLGALLSSGRSARLYRDVVETGDALYASCYDSYPSDKFPSLFVISGVPANGNVPFLPVCASCSSLMPPAAFCFHLPTQSEAQFTHGDLYPSHTRHAVSLPRHRLLL